MIALILKLFLAHILGDFVLQPNSWVESKMQKKEKSLYLYLHLLVHLACLLVLLSFDLKYWLGIVIIIASHFIIDLAKLHLQKRWNSSLWFWLDQLAHVAILIGVIHMYEPFAISIPFLYSPRVLLFLSTILFVTFVIAVLIKNILGAWKFLERDGGESLKNAGRYIGMLERLFVFGFFLMAQYQAIGFLIVAKSIFRFNDLSRAKDRKLTEYILIGTLLSILMAVMTAVGFQFLNRVVSR